MQRTARITPRDAHDHRWVPSRDLLWLGPFALALSFGEYRGMTE